MVRWICIFIANGLLIVNSLEFKYFSFNFVYILIFYYSLRREGSIRLWFNFYSWLI